MYSGIDSLLKSMLTLVALLAITLVLALLVEAHQSGIMLVIIVTLVIVIKGSLVIEQLMGLRVAHPVIRAMMHSYFWVLSFLITLVFIYPQLRG